MSEIILPTGFRQQPQNSTPLKNPNFWRLVDIQGLPLMGTAAASTTQTLFAGAGLAIGGAGRCLNFPVDGSRLDYGANSALYLSTQTGIVVVEVPTSFTQLRATLFNTNSNGSFSSGFTVTVTDTGKIFVLKQDFVGMATTSKSVRMGGVSTVVWSYNNVSGSLRIAIDGTLETFNSPQTFNHNHVSRNAYYAGNTVQANAHKQYLFALSAECDRVADAQLIDWSLNPWQIFKAPARRLAFVPTTGPTFIDTDFAYSGNSLFSGERTSVFNFYYNFNGLGEFSPNFTKLDNTKIQASGSSTSNIQNGVTHSVNYTSNGTCVVSYRIGKDSIFAQDNFTGSAGQDVTIYNTDWFKSIYNVADQQFIITDEQRAITTSSASGTPVFYHRNIPATADYDVSADIHIKSAIETVGIIGRASGDSTRNHYMAQFAGSTVKLFRVIGWVTATQLAFKNITLTAGQTYNLKLSMFGDSIKVYVDNVEQISVTDSTITEKGMVGIRNFYSSPISYTTGMHIDNFLSENTNSSNKNIVSINMFPAGTSINDPKIQSIISQNLSSNNISVFSAEQSVINNTEVSSISLTTEEFLDSIITSSKVSGSGLSVSNVSNNVVKLSNANIGALGIQDTKIQSVINVDTNISGSSSQNINDIIIQNDSFDSIGLSETDIKSAYIKLCELISNSSSTDDLISAIAYNTEINSIGSCIITFYEGTDGGTTFINVDMVISGTSIVLPTIRKIINTNLSANNISSVVVKDNVILLRDSFSSGISEPNLKDNVILLSNVSSDGTSSGNINTQNLLSRNVSITGESDTSIITNIILNSRIISAGSTNQLINSVSIQNTDIESVGSSILSFIDGFIQSTNFLSNGTCIVSLQQGQDGGKIIINVDFVVDGTSSINNNTDLILNTNLQSQSSSDFISNFTKLDGQDFTASGSSIVNLIREYLILQTNRKYLSIVERRNYVSSVERRNYVSKVKE